MTKLWVMRGLSGSGKSTRAAEIAKETGAVIVNRDLLRLMLLGSYWTGRKVDEDRVTIAEESQVSALSGAGIDTIIDATHLNPAYLRKWAKLSTRLGVEFEVVDVRMPVDICITRDRLRERSIGRDVILQQAKRWPEKNWPIVTAPAPLVVEPVEFVVGLSDAVIFDIDGTLARMTDRSPYDYSKVSTDAVDESVRWIYQSLRERIYQSLREPSWWRPEMIIMSGRDDTCRCDTIGWLSDHGIFYDQLLMRPAGSKDDRGNKIPDTHVKLALFNEHVRGKFNVRAVFDDRDQVVALWRQLGLKCCQVQPGNF